MDFVTIANSGYIAALRFQLKQTARLYPESITWVYDIGLSGDEVVELRNNYSVIVVDLPVDYGSWILTYGWSHPRRDFGPITCHRIDALRDALERANGGKVVWLDADAFLADRVDELEENGVAIGITRRFPEEKSDESIVNAGALFLLDTQIRNVQFVVDWKHRLRSTQDEDLEQGVLSGIMHDAGIANRVGDSGVWQGHHVTSIPGSVYNNYHYWDVREGVKVWHLKAGAFRQMTEEELTQVYISRERTWEEIMEGRA